MADAFDPFYKWLAIPPEEQPPNHYRLLGTKLYESDRDVIETAADQRMTHIRTFQGGKRAAESQRLLSEISKARICLLDAKQKAAYDHQLRGQLDGPKSSPQESAVSDLQLHPAWPEGQQPKSLEEFQQCLAASGLISRDASAAFLKSLPPNARPKDHKDLAKELVRAGKLTKYQARAVYEGKIAHLSLGNYIVVDHIGSGGMGEVLKAQHRRMKRVVALKVLPAEAIKKKGAIERFQREVEAAAQLNHPNIVTAHDADEAGGVHFLVCEYVDGKDLSQIVAESGRLPVEQAVECIIQAAQGLAYAHEHGVVHRDIKPGNMLLAKEGTVKILDMGLARLEGSELSDSDSDSEDTVDRRLTQSGQIMGTVDYMAPEQAEDTREADHRSDIYSLGCTLYRLVTGAAPFESDTVMKTLIAHRDAEIPSLRAARAEVPPRLDAIYRQMLAKDSADRPQSMAEVITALETSLAPATQTAKPAPARKKESSTDMALSAFFQNVSVEPVQTEQRVKADAEETINRSPGDDTGDQLPAVEPLEEATADSAKRKKQLIWIGAGGAVLAILLLVITVAALLGPSETNDVGLAGRKEEVPGEARDTDGAPQTPATTADRPDGKRGDDDGSDPPKATATYPGINDGWRQHLILDGQFGRGQLVVFSQDGRRLASIQANHAYIWQVSDGQLLHEIKTAGAGLSWSPNGKLLGISTKPNGRIRLFDTTAGHLLDKPLGPGDTGFAFAPDGQTAAGQTAAGQTAAAVSKWTGKAQLQVWNVADRKLLWSQPTANAGGMGARFVAYSPDGKLLATGGEPAVTLRHADSGEVFARWKIPGSGGMVNHGAFSPNGEQLAVATDGSQAFVWDVAAGKLLFKLHHPGRVHTVLSVGYSPDGRFLVVGVSGGHAWLWDAETGKRLNPIRHFRGVLAANFSPDGNLIATTGNDQLIVWARAAGADPGLAIAPFEKPAAKAHQQAWADFLGLPVEKEVELPGGAKMTFMLIPPGEFMMGSTAEDRARFLEEAKAANDKWAGVRIPSEGPQHQVRITQAFYLGKYEVAQAQWQAVMGSNPSKFQDNPAHPVEQVRWGDIRPFLAKLNGSTSADKMTFALPTEAQWEYACRAGTTKPYYSGESENDLRQHGWFNANSGGRTHPVGQLTPNAFGLYDLHGNVWEWCADWYAADYYAKARVNDPTGPAAGSGRVYRGGGWYFGARLCRSAYRFDHRPGHRHVDLGFRLAMTIDAARHKPRTTAGDTWTDLFNENDLSGWKGLDGLWRVENGQLVGSSKPDGLKFNTCLVSNRKYRDFAMQFEVKLAGNRANSGLQVRSELIDMNKLNMSGAQVDMGAPSWGSLYGEGSGGMMQEFDPHRASEIVKPNDFNKFYVRCEGKHVTVKVNGTTTIDGKFPSMPDEGSLGWQIHRGGPMEVTIRNVQLHELVDSLGSTAPPLTPGKWMPLLADDNQFAKWSIATGDNAHATFKDGELVVRAEGEYNALLELSRAVEADRFIVHAEHNKHGLNAGLILRFGSFQYNNAHFTKNFELWRWQDVGTPNQSGKRLIRATAATPVDDVWVAFNYLVLDGRLTAYANGTKLYSQPIEEKQLSTLNIAVRRSVTCWRNVAIMRLTDEQAEAVRAGRLPAYDPAQVAPSDQPATDDRTPPSAKSNKITPDNNWVDVLPLALIERDTVSGGWNRDGDKLNISTAQDQHARLALPLVPKGSYAIEFRVTRTKGSDDVAILLPIGNRSVAFHTSAFGKWAGVDMIGGAGVFKRANPTRAASLVTTGKPIVARIAAMPKGDQVRLVIEMDDAKLADVTVPLADLSEHSTWHADLKSKSRLTLGAHEVDAVIDYVKLKMLDGHAEILGPDRASVKVDASPTETRPKPPATVASKWVELFNGRDLTGWEPVGDQKLWSVAGGAIVASGKAVGWLSTTKEYANFVLQFEFRLPAKGNSGVFLRAPRKGRLNGGEFLEIQLLDDPTSKSTRNLTGAAYNIAQPRAAGALRPASSGQWNQMEIRAAGRHIQVALNGKLINAFDLDKVQIPDQFGKNAARPSGFIGLQCNNTGAAFRNIRIRPAD